VLLTFGGNGAVHACGIADVAGVKEILTVPFASVRWRRRHRWRRRRSVHR
jgi:N-methylhydantoinase A/oxoprolinase/acetone carboxylase beta subunit